MVACVVELLKIFILTSSEFVTEVDSLKSQDSDFIVGSTQTYTIIYDADYSGVHLGDYLPSNLRNSIRMPSSIPRLANVVVTGQDTLPSDMAEDIMFSQQISFTEELVLDYNNTHSNCSLNSTCEPIYLTAPTFQQSDLTRVIVLLLIAIFSLIGNIATLSSILRTGRQGTSTVYMLLVQLAIADLLVSIFCILADALWTLSVQWYGGNFFCKGVKFMQLFALYLSTFLLVLIGFDRLCAVRFPMKRARAKHHVRTGIVCVWTFSAIFSLPQVFFYCIVHYFYLSNFN